MAILEQTEKTENLKPWVMQISKHDREDRILRKLIIPEILEYVIKNDGFVAGGAIRSVFTSDHINDFDIFFRKKEDFNKGGIFEEGIETNLEDNYRIMFYQSDVAWTHKPEREYEKLPLHQMICAVYGEPEDILKKFDFTMSMAAWVPKTGEFIMDSRFLQHCAQKRLFFNSNADYPICSLWRAVKFIKRGWKLSAIDSIKLSLKIHNIKIYDHHELKRQLMGIDTLFLKELTDALESKKEVAYDYGEALEFISEFIDKEEES
jgi:hypothetical protein